jgi:hypothetical protein
MRAMKKDYDYPVSTPYRPPEQLAVQLARLKRWTLALGGAGLVLLVGAAAGAVFWWQALADHGKETTPTQTATVPAAGTAPAPAAPVPSAPSQTSPQPTEPPKEATQKRAAPPPGAPSPKTPAAGFEHLLDALGGLSGAHLSQTLLNLRLVADAVEKQIYTKEEGEKILVSLVDLMDQVDDYLKDLQELDLKAEEKQTIKRIQKVSDALRRQVAALRAYWQTGGAEQLTAYRAARQAALEALDDLLKQP